MPDYNYGQINFRQEYDKIMARRAAALEAAPYDNLSGLSVFALFSTKVFPKPEYSEVTVVLLPEAPSGLKRALKDFWSR